MERTPTLDRSQIILTGGIISAVLSAIFLFLAYMPS